MSGAVVLDLLTVAAVLPFLALGAFAWAAGESYVARRPRTARGKRRAAFLSR